MRTSFTVVSCRKNKTKLCMFHFFNLYRTIFVFKSRSSSNSKLTSVSLSSFVSSPTSQSANTKSSFLCSPTNLNDSSIVLSAQIRQLLNFYILPLLVRSAPNLLFQKSVEYQEEQNTSRKPIQPMSTKN